MAWFGDFFEESGRSDGEKAIAEAQSLGLKVKVVNRRLFRNHDSCPE